MKVFNINDHVWVRLTEDGLKFWENDFNKYAPEGYLFSEHFSRHTKDGWTEFQLHALIDLFGDTMHGKLPFETNIRIDEKYLKNTHP